MSDPAFLRLATATEAELDLIARMSNRLSHVNVANDEAIKRYEGSYLAQQFGISIPPSMRGLHTVAGWGGTVVDVLEERLDWLGWSSDADDFGLSEVYSQNALDVDSGMGHLDALIFGLSFIAVGSGFAGEPHPLITCHSPQTMTGLWDRRTRRLSDALAVVTIDGSIVEATLYSRGMTSVFEPKGGRWLAVERDQHGLDRLPVVAMPNRVRGSRELGRSEITRAVRYYTDAAARTLHGLEVNREFYNAPQRIGLNVSDDMFEDEAGNPISPWSSIQGRIWNLPPNEDGMPAPDVKQFSPASPAPYIDQVKGYATLLAAEAGIPPAYLGFQTDNPASADAIRAGEARLIKRAERRQGSFGRSWLEAGRLALAVRDGVVPDTYDTSVSAKWRDAATPTRAAAADEAFKLSSGDDPIIPRDSSVLYDRIGLSPADQRQLAADKRRAAGRRVLSALTPPADANGE